MLVSLVSLMFFIPFVLEENEIPDISSIDRALGGRLPGGITPKQVSDERAETIAKVIILSNDDKAITNIITTIINKTKEGGN